MGKSLVNGGKEYDDDAFMGRRINMSKATKSSKHSPRLGPQIYITWKVRSKRGKRQQKQLGTRKPRKRFCPYSVSGGILSTEVSGREE